MAKFLVNASYTPEGARGLVKSSASRRREAVAEICKSLGGKLETFYFTFGEEDAVLIIDLPDAEAALAVGFAVRASGMVHSKTTVLIPVEEVDRAIQRHVEYAPPGA
ncbi:MAG: GYD domain-containing protein [Candidatus Eremiobacteraeota bacterium]|nr:GYD domain-containing protein [Candidatus Eremiobacteraeota bacterium]